MPTTPTRLPRLLTRLRRGPVRPAGLDLHPTLGPASGSGLTQTSIDLALGHPGLR